MRKSALFSLGLVVMVLVALGLIVLFSASEENGFRLFKDSYYFIKRQFVYLGLGVGLATAVSLFDYHKWRDCEFLSWGFYFAVIVLLLAVFVFKPVNGSRRWLVFFGSIRLQPSELAKLATVIVMAVWLDKSSWRIELPMRGAFWPSVLIGAIALPILLEPDFGSVMVVGAVGFLLMFVAGTRILHFLPYLAAGAGAVAVRVLTNENRMARISAFFGGKQYVGAKVVDAATKNADYQANQSLTAFFNSDIWGVGLYESMQKHAYLPEAHTDFVFAVGAEELGIVYSVGVVLLFVTFFALSVYIARKASDRFGRLLVVGMAFIVFFQAIFNIGVVCKALPTKGMALPFFSYGGTNMLTTFFAVGTILSVGIHSLHAKKRTMLKKVLAN